MHRFHRALLALLATGLGCSGLLSQGAPPAAKQPEADRIYLGQIVTVDAKGDVAEGVAVKDGRILVVGDSKHALAHRGPLTEVRDLENAALLPGFIDAHSHFLAHGVLLAHGELPRPSAEEVPAALQAAQLHYASNGYTTVQDGATDAPGLAILQRAAQEGRLFLDVVALPDWRTLPELLAQPGIVFGRAYQGHLKLGGVKILLDGSAEAHTAYFTEPLRVPGPNGEKGWRGVPIVSQSEVDAVFRLAYANGVQTYTHANGDAAIDMLLAAHEAAGSPEGRRPVVIHSQFVRDEQLNAYARIGAVPSFFTNHAFFWGDVHIQNLGQERAYFLSPLRSAAARDLHFTNHSDYAVTPLDPLFMLWTATERTSRSGVVVGPDERVSISQALRALTIDAAYQYFEEDSKGSIEPGKLADFVILERNPLLTPPEALRAIKVLETIKEGETVWSAEAPSSESETQTEPEGEAEGQ